MFKVMGDLKLLKDDGVLIIEHRKDIKLPSDIHGFSKVKCKKYGTASMSIYNKNLL